MLRTRLFVSLVPFVVILLAIGIYAIVLFSRITANVDLTVTGNYRSVMAAEQMRLALSRMEEGVLIGLGGAKGLGPAVFEESAAGNKALGTAVFEQNRRIFETNLDLQLHNSKSPQESDLNLRLSNNYHAFREAGVRILSLNQLAEQRRAFQLSFEPGLPTIDGLLDEIYQLNHHAILATTQNVERIMRGVTRWMVIGIVIALMLASYACYKLAQYILEPIQSLTRATHELGEGNLDQVVAVTSRDELGDLAQSFNKMAAQLRDYRQSTTEKIVRLHQTMEATLASFPDPIFVLNRSGGIELMNLAANQLSQALKLKNELPEHLQETALKSLKDGESFLPHSFKEVVSFRLDAEEKFFLPRILAMRNEDHDLIGVAVVLYDVTRFRLLDDAKTNLVATVSHEIRTPLTSVRMVLHLLLEKTVGALTPRQNELLIAARDDSERLLRILNDLLDLTRLEQGNTGLRQESTAPAELIQYVADIMREAVMSKNLKLTCNVDPGLPPVLVDRQRINHVFTNLVNNAIKYSPSGSEIILQAKWSDDREVQFSVLDEGPGVPEDFQDFIFDRFFRVPDQTKTGAGLGLSIAREIVLAHGGRIGVRNRPQQGSEFYFLLAGVEEEVPA
ncbi:MAG: integral rane sensor signal transduction histidine kinase [Pedosphaera sp.]|nr:integral rane sensor signal transduction histidine kinase [Pedosphaera sp.]